MFCESEIKLKTNSDTYKELSIYLSIGSILFILKDLEEETKFKKSTTAPTH